MLSRLEIKNFRTHKNTVLEFVKGINIIVGVSNQGKTNIFRAFNWLRTNRPKGNRFVSNFAKENDVSLVKAVFSNAKHKEEYVEIVKGRKGSAEYSIGNENGEMDRFKKVGFDVPDKISEFLRIDNINMQAQLDQHFLITSSPGEVAREINRITHLEKVDVWIKEITSKINSSNKEYKLYEEQIVQLEERIKEIPDLEKLERSIIRLEKKEERLSEIDKEEGEIFRLIESIVEANFEIDKLKIFVEAEAALKLAEAIQKDIDSCMGDIFGLEDIVSRLEEALEDSSVNFKDMDDAIKDCISISASLDRKEEKIINLQELLKDITITELDIGELDQDLGVALDDFSSLMRKIKRCPLCTADITGSMMKEIMETL
jgi:exonuclease SbcC